jgi:hypothetical protein
MHQETAAENRRRFRRRERLRRPLDSDAAGRRPPARGILYFRTMPGLRAAPVKLGFDKADSVARKA